jgi:glutamyl-tRNA reductase
MGLVLVGLNHETAPLPVRERVAYSKEEAVVALQELKPLLSQALLLSTCNRTELYAMLADPADLPRVKEALFFRKILANGNDTYLYERSDADVVRHLFRVACGLDSMVLGETEILGQLKKAYDLALQHKYTGSRLNKAFQKAFNIAKQIRTETNIQRGSTSVGSVAVELAEKIFSSLEDRLVMVIGAGDTSEKTVRALLSRGAHSVIVSNRTYDRAVDLANALGGRAVHFEDWASEFDKIDIVISSTAAPHYILDRVQLEPLMKLRRNRPLLLIDIAVPRDIEPEVNFLENVFLYNIDDLQAIAEDYLKQRREEIVRCEKIIREKVKGLQVFPGPQSLPASSNQALAFGHE